MQDCPPEKEKNGTIECRISPSLMAHYCDLRPGVTDCAGAPRCSTEILHVQMALIRFKLTDVPYDPNGREGAEPEICDRVVDPGATLILCCCLWWWGTVPPDVATGEMELGDLA